MPAIGIPAAGAAGHQLAARAFVEGSNQVSVFVVGIVFSVIAIVVMALRVYCRVVITQGGLGIDDYLMLAGVIMNVGLSIANMVCAYYGAGVHTPDLNFADFPALFQSNYANRLLYVIALCLVKTSLLVFYLRVDPRKWTRYAIYFTMFTIIGLTIATVFICIFECWPPSTYWNVEAQLSGAALAVCMDPKERQKFFEANGIINIVQDICIYVLPIPMLWRLQVPRRQKVALLFLFCVGFVALAAACVRYYYVLKLSNGEDIWYYFADSLNWCSIEVYAAIICGSASTFRVLFKTYMPRIWGGSRYGISGARGKSHPYDQSHSGSFALKTFGQGEEKRSKLSKREISFLDSNSDEAIVKSDHLHQGNQSSGRGPSFETNNNAIVMNSEFTMEVSDTSASLNRELHKGHVVPSSLR